MNTKIVRELKSIAKDKGLRGYYKLKKADIVALLLEQPTEEMPTPPPRDRGKIITSPQEMNEFEKEEMKKSRPVVKNKLNEWSGWLVDYVPTQIKSTVSKTFLRAKSSIPGLYDGAKNTLNSDVEGEAEKQNQEEEEEDVDLTPHEHERALKGVCDIW